MTQHYAVVGNPISHSKSPQIHSTFAQQTGQDLDYEKIAFELDGFAEGVKEFFSDADNKGLNVTVPFKEEAFDLCEELTDRAQRAGAVNTLWLEAGQLKGDTTDGIGLVNDLKINHGVELKQKKILIVGAGGAVRGVLQPILEEGPEKITICNRTLSKVDPLIALFSDLGAIEKSSFENLQGQYDIVINGTSAGLSGDVPPLPDQVIGSDTIAYDMIYGSETTSFIRWALECGARRGIDGLGMLVEQAAEAFFIWRGVRPETQQVINDLRN